MNAPLSQPVHGYPRAEIEEFLAAADEERGRLEAQIADANSRIARARSAIGTHRVMTAMLLEAQRELSEIRRNAELEAERIVAAAEIEAQAIERGADVAATPVPRRAASTGPTVGAPTPRRVPEPAIDLGAIGDAPVGNDEFFDFLRGALADDQPLGPAAD